MKILFTFENPLPSPEADAEVFTSTASALAPLAAQAWLHVPLPQGRALQLPGVLPIVRAWAPLKPAALRHFCCGLTLVFHKEFREADLVYTRNLWVAWVTMACGRKVAFDHYRPWPDQIPPLKRWIHRLVSNPRFIVHVCHSDYTRRKYLELGVPPEKMRTIRNGFDPGRLPDPLPLGQAKAAIGIAVDTKTVVYTGRLNHKKGLALVIAVARRLPDILFVLVGSYGEGPIEKLAAGLSNVRIVGWQPPEQLGRYISAADVLLIPPSLKPLTQFGSTVLPLKLFFYMASGRAILAGSTPDVSEVLQHGRNAFLCRPDDEDALAAGVRALTSDAGMAERLAAGARADCADLTWARRAERIVALLQERLQAAPVEPALWTRSRTLGWLGHSRRWFVHLLRTRSWILPPEDDFVAAARDVGSP